MIRKNHRVRTDRFEPFIFSEARHTPDEGVDTQSVENGIDCGSIGTSAQGVRSVVGLSNLVISPGSRLNS